MIDREDRPRHEEAPTIPQEPFFRKRIPEDFRDPSLLLEQSQTHFQEAIESAYACINPDELGTLSGAVTTLSEIAEIMAVSGTPPIPVLEKVQQIQGEWSEKLDRRSISYRIANIYGMLGRHDEMRASLEVARSGSHASYAYAQAGNELVRRGEDPTPILTEGLKRVERSAEAPMFTYGQIAKVFKEANLDPSAVLKKAENRMKQAKKSSIGFDSAGRVVQELAQVYADSGLFTDALRMADYLDPQIEERYREWYESSILRVVYRSQLEQGNYNGAIETSEKLDWKPAKPYAMKALLEAKSGDDPSSSIEHALTLAEDVPYARTYLYEHVYPIVGTALALSGNEAAAIQQFTKIQTAMEEMDSMERVDVGISLAVAVDEAGLDAEEILRQCIRDAEAFLAEDPDFHMQLGFAELMKEEAIRVMIQRGYLSAAQAHIDEFLDGWSRAKLLAELAGSEARIAMTLNAMPVGQLAESEEEIEHAPRPELQRSLDEVWGRSQEVYRNMSDE